MVVEHVIAFYPGACGNRYFQYLGGTTSWEPQRWYDSDLKQKQTPSNRYLTDVKHDQPTVLTHSVNTPQIHHYFPDAKITVINYDLQSCLRREYKMQMGNIWYTHNAGVDPDQLRLDHYNIVKEPFWPDVTTIAEYNQLPERIYNEANNDFTNILDYNRAYATIAWHTEYYTKNPMDFKYATTIIDLNTCDSIFCKSAKQEIDSFSCSIFDKAWDDIDANKQ